MLIKRRAFFTILGGGLFVAATLASWVQWGNWPDPRPVSVFHDADVIVILGGGDDTRSREGLILATAHPQARLVVTGDGGRFFEPLIEAGIRRERIIHETAATSTVENAKFTKPLLDELGAERVILVTNWYHAQRALKIFRKYQPAREFCISYETRPDPLMKWDRAAARRERLAAVHNWIVHSVWSW